MKQSEAIRLFEAGKMIAKVTYLGMRKETLRSEAPVAGKKAANFLVKHSILWAEKTYEMAEFKNSQDELDAAQPMCERFTEMYAMFDKLEDTTYGCRARGKLHRIEAE